MNKINRANPLYLINNRNLYPNASNKKNHDKCYRDSPQNTFNQ